MLTVTVTADLRAMKAACNAFTSDQAPFAIAKALTETARDVRDAVRADMPNRFILRRQWIVKGIQVEMATKKNLEATVYSRDDSFMARQEVGGIKAPKYGRHVAVPMPAIRRTKTQLIAKSELPNNLQKAFLIHAKDGRLYLAKRFARGKRAGVQLLYELLNQTKVKPRLGLHDIGIATARRVFDKNLRDAVEFAMRTAK